MDSTHHSRATDATWLPVSEAAYHQERVTAMYERAWSAQQKSKSSGTFASMFSDFSKCTASPFGVHSETQSASEVGLWHRERLCDIRKVPVIGGLHRYATGESRTVLFVLFERNRLRVLTD